MAAVLDVFTINTSQYTEALAHLVQYLAIKVGDHQHLIFLVSALVATLIAMVMLIPRYDAVAIGRWVKYFGWAFALFAAQYALKWVIASIDFTGRALAIATLILALLDRMDDLPGTSSHRFVIQLPAATNSAGQEA